MTRSGPWQVASDLHVPDGVTVGIGGAEQVPGTGEPSTRTEAVACLSLLLVWGGNESLPYTM